MVKNLDLEAGGAKIAILNKGFAEDFDIHTGDRVELINGKKRVIVMINITEFTINHGEIGLFREVWESEGITSGVKIFFKPIPKPDSLNYIKKKLDGDELSKKEIYSIIHDAVNNTLSSVELATFISAVYINGMTIKETAQLTKAMADFGEKLTFKGIVVDKHCIGGVPNNRTTMVVVPILAAAGLKIPKLSSRAISSAAGTADTMEVLCNISISSKELKKIVNKIGACIAWGGAMKIAYADDELIRIRHPMSLDPTP
ncbi:MAG: thymidine phosphorylase, partial [Nanoarchaeota archaeon]|nr:thymidine phosphorylase [Nanoarchaeota archaeon]